MPGFEPEFVLTHPKPGLLELAPDGELAGELDGVPLRHIADASGESYDVAVATWWTTAADLWEVEAERRVVFLQNIEHRFYGERDPWFERMGAASVLGLPVHYIVVGSFMQRLLEELRPDARSVLVRYGIDKQAFAPQPRVPRDGPLRVLVEGQPSLWFKGVAEGVEAVRSMSEPAQLTLVALDPSYGHELGADRVVGGLDPAGMAALYARTDVMVKFARFEGFGLAPLEAFHLGVPCVTTPYSAHEDYVVHGRNGIVVGFDDPTGAGRALDALARGEALLERLGAGALRTAESWPDHRASSAAFADALEELAGGPPPSCDRALAHLMRSQRLWIEEGREIERQATVEFERTRADLEDHRQALARVRSTRAYRAYTAARRVLPRSGRR